MLEGHFFVARVDEERKTLGFFTTVGIVAATRQEFAKELEEALDAVIKKNKIQKSDVAFKKSFCRISEVYEVYNSNSFADLGGMTYFNENWWQIAFSNFLKICLSLYKSHEIIKLK